MYGVSKERLDLVESLLQVPFLFPAFNCGFFFNDDFKLSFYRNNLTILWTLLTIKF